MQQVDVCICGPRPHQPNNGSVLVPFEPSKNALLCADTLKIASLLQRLAANELAPPPDLRRNTLLLR